MQIKIDVRGLDELQQKLRQLPSELRDKATAMAVNKTADKANTELRRAITGEFAISAAEVRDSVVLRRAKAQRNAVEAVISIFGSRRKRGRSLNMIHFLAAVQTQLGAMRTRGSRAKKRELQALEKQLGFLIKKGAGLKQIKGAFIGNQGRTIFRRTGDKRLPIEPVQVIGVSQMFTTERIRRRVMEKIDRDLVVETERAVREVMRRSGL